MTVSEPLIAGVELGGTKCIATLARGRKIVRQARWPTQSAATLDHVSNTLTQWYGDTPFAGIGIASFGPIHVDLHHAAFGRMGNTPKPGWAGVNVRAHFADRFDIPIGIDTDVAGAALAEGAWGASQGCTVHGYVTIGTGVGFGLVVEGKAVHGHLHPEAGHLRIRRQVGDSFAGACPTHGDCLEGLIGGPALAARALVAVADLGEDDPLWEQVAGDISEWTTMMILALSPQRLVMGGGVMQARPHLLPMICKRTAALLNGYIEDLDEAALEKIIVHPGLGFDTGPLGAVLLGQRAVTIQARDRMDNI